MPRSIAVNVPHNLGKAEARRRIEEGFGAQQQDQSGALLGMFSFQKRWQGDRLQFEASAVGQRISATLDVLDDAVQIRIDLPDLLAAFADRIKEGVAKETTKALGTLPG